MALSAVACFLVVGGCVGTQHRNLVRHRASYACPMTAGRVTVDGSLDEAAWRGAQVIREFGIPVTHEAPRRETEARILWDRRYLYVAFKAADEDVLAVHDTRDSDTYRDDVLEVFFRTEADGEDYYNIEINALGTVRDEYHQSLEGGVRRRRTGWNCEGIQVAVKIAGTLNDWRDCDEHWQLEVAIPFRSLPSLKGKTPEAGDVWRFHLARIERAVRGKGCRELTSCAPLARPNYHFLEGWPRLIFGGLR